MPLEGCLAGGWGSSSACVYVCLFCLLFGGREKEKWGSKSPREAGEAQRHASSYRIPIWACQAAAPLGNVRTPERKMGSLSDMVSGHRRRAALCQSSMLPTHRAELGFGGAGEKSQKLGYVAKCCRCCTANRVLGLQLRQRIIHFTSFLHIHEVGRYGLKPMHCSTYVQ